MAIRTDNFQGMNNVKTKIKVLAEPSIILNAHVDADGALVKRDGCQKVIDLPGAHSMWTDGKGTVLCMAKGKLYLLTDNGRTSAMIVDTMVPDGRTSYLEISGLIYISNKYWCGIYDPVENLCMPWGTELPPAPQASRSNSGDLSEGVYQICYTLPGIAGRRGGNGPITSFKLIQAGGISLSNVPQGASVWCSDQDGSQLLFATNGSTINTFPSAQPLDTLWGSPPVPMCDITYAFGRIWGGRDDRMYYSDPYQPELFKLTENFFDLQGTVGMIAKTSGGLYVGTNKEVFFFAGTDPLQMTQAAVGPAVVPGTLCYASSLGDLGRNVPMWIGKGGAYAGTSQGQIINLVKSKFKIDPADDPGASLYCVRDGQTRILFTYQQGSDGQDFGIGDDAACEVIRKGTVI